MARLALSNCHVCHVPTDNIKIFPVCCKCKDSKKHLRTIQQQKYFERFETMTTKLTSVLFYDKSLGYCVVSVDSEFGVIARWYNKIYTIP